MSNQSVTVPTGIASTMLSSGLPSGSVIQNLDSKNTVWLSSNAAVAPGNGINLTALGSVNWAGGPVYAVVDTGVTAPVNLSLSGDVSQVTNPVAVGSAVAAQLLSQGVPSVFLGDTLYQGSPTTSSLTINGVAKYSSLNIILTSLNLAQRWQLNYIVNGSNFFAGQYITSDLSNGINVDSVVRGNTFTLSWTNTMSSLNSSVTIIGTNRTTTDKILTPLIPVTANLNQAFTANTAVNIINNYVSNGKESYLRMVVTGGNNGFLTISSLNGNGTAQFNIDVVDSKTGVTGSDGQEVEKMIIIPPGDYKIMYTSRTAATYTVVVTLIPQS